MFTQSCFIRKNTPELRKKLEDLGYTNSTNDINGDWLFVSHGILLTVSKDFNYANSKDIDCGQNEDLFLAISALRDDTDKNQWFVMDCNVAYLNDTNEIADKKGDFVYCIKDKWFADYDKDGTPFIFSSRNTPSHKASIEELFKKFV